MSETKRTSLRLTRDRERRLQDLQDDDLVEAGSNAAAIDYSSQLTLDYLRHLRSVAEDLEEEFQREASRYAAGSLELDVTVELKAE